MGHHPKPVPLGRLGRLGHAGQPGQKGPTMSRTRLPDRRPHEVVAFDFGGIQYIAGVGYYADGRLAEIFMSAGKLGTSADVAARDASVATSLLLQHGCPVETLRKALMRNVDGTAGSPLARVLVILNGAAL